jgi:putative heme-binding domain-containing protein
LRLENVDLAALPQAKAALLRQLRREPESEDFLTLIEKFELKELTSELMASATKQGDTTRGVEAARLLLKLDQLERITEVLRDDSNVDAAALLAALGRTDNPKIIDTALHHAVDPKTSPALRRAGIAAAGRFENGQQRLLAFLQDGRFSEDLHVALANVLLSSKSAKIRMESAEHLSLPKTASREPLPPLSELAKMTGDAVQGVEVFRKEGECIKCHRVRDEGKQVGPDLSEIGSKLAPEAMYVAILDPSAAISFNFETYNVLMDDGRDFSGVLVSQTDDSVTIKTAEAIERTIDRDEIDELIKQQISLMPSDLAQKMTTQQLVDVVEYLMALKKK